MPETSQLHRIEAIVFDFDGTLAELRLDFGEMKRRIADLAGRYFGAPPPIPAMPALEWIEVLGRSAGQFRYGAIEWSKDGSRRRAKEFKAEARALIMEMELESARSGRLFSFTRPVLDSLRSRSVKIAIITRNCEEAVRLVFPDIEEYCQSFLARDHVARVKPDPEHLLLALKNLAGLPESALMVGDHPLDIQTGKSAGVRTAGVWSGSATEASLVQCGAHWTAPDCRELIRLLGTQALI